MPLLAINGDEDPLVRYGGQWVWRNFRVKQPVLSVEETMRLWVHRNGCREAPETEVLPDVDKGDETRVVRTRWGACRNDAEVVLYRIEGGGHIWPGSDDWDFWGLLGEKSRDIEAAEVIWEFFEQHENPYVKEAPAAE
jgi:polyhydroxybutyrate depolymerase